MKMGKNIWPNDKALIKNRIYQKLVSISSVPDRDLIIREGKITHSPVRTDAGRTLPEYYLVYFVLHDIMQYNNEGREEKVAFSFPIKYKDYYFDIEYRKLGLGVFAYSETNSECYAKEIVQLICSATKIAHPYFEFLIEEAKSSSNISLFNNNKYLYGRYLYLLDKYKNLTPPKENKHRNIKDSDNIVSMLEEAAKHSFDIKNYHLEKQWLSISVMEAYFSWTEHLFPHLFVISNNESDGKKIINLANKEWLEKYKHIIDINSNKEGKLYHDEFSIVRNQLRNFITHGSIGKEYNAFSFHSSVGAIPVRMSNNKSKYSITSDLYFEHQSIIQLFENFTKYLWDSKLGPAMFYLLESSLPTILTYAKNNYYKDAMISMSEMKNFVFYLSRIFDDSANMDW